MTRDGNIGFFRVLLVLVIGLSYVRLQGSVKNESSSYMGTAESLRKNIEDLARGELVFSDDNLPYDENELSDITPQNQSEYDFIVIGAGSAGATIASRLSEIPDVTVLLIEAGGKEYPIMDIPLMATSLQLSDQVNWKYQTESSDKYCLGMKDHKSNWVRGKATGGSSVLNFMAAMRCNKKDYDDWATATGDDSWSYKSMLKYLMKLENYKNEGADVDNKFRNNAGPLPIINYPSRFELADAFIAAGQELGYPELRDIEEKTGFSYLELTGYKGERWSTNRAYLRPAKNRTNLFLTRNSLVQKILIDEETRRARGVRFSKSNAVIEVTARKEIILSAGAIGSPQILMLSGIGPAKHLQDLNITVIQDAPVGENLMEHVIYCGLTFKVNDSSTFKESNLSAAVEDYVKSRDGPLGFGPGLEALAWLNVDDPSPTNEHPNVELLFGGAMTGLKDPLFSKVINLADSYRNELNVDKFNHSAYTIMPMLMTPKSRGKILLRSSDPHDKPKIYPNYFSHPDDARILIKGIRMAIKLTQTAALRKYGSEMVQIPLPNCQQHEKDSDDYWECAVRTYTLTIHHASSTCKMGKEGDKSSVVDPRLNVIGVKNLRVVDASIMPKIVSAHPHIPVIAIAEKISDVIKKQYNYLV